MNNNTAKTITASDILSCMNEPEDVVCIRVLPDRKSSDVAFTGQKYQFRCGTFMQHDEDLRCHNSMNRGIFFVVNHGGDRDSDITRINAQFMEIDDGSFEEQQAKIDAFPLPPSLIIKTRKSLHTYWLIKNGRKELFRDIQKGLIKHFGADPACINESRLMRLPGYYHCKKDPPVMVECICFHPERRYTQEQLIDVLEVLPSSAKPVERHEVEGGDQPGLKLVAKTCSFINHCRENAETLPEPLWQAMIGNLSFFKGGDELIHEYSKPYPGYSPEETDEKIKRYKAAGYGPITCEVIESRGYTCPRKKSGECRCKAPAGLSCVPPELSLLREMLAEQPVTRSRTEDVQTASDFIADYMYNFDPAPAEAFIGNELKDRFELKASDAHALLTGFKKLSRSFAKWKEKNFQDGRELPPWYAHNGKKIEFHPGILAGHMAIMEPVIYSARSFYQYEGGVYRPIDDDDAAAMIQSKMIPFFTTMSDIKDATNQWRLLVKEQVNALNPNPYIINLQNGLYNVIEGTLSPHAPDYYSTVQLHASYDPEAKCPRFTEFLDQVFSGDREQIKLVQEMMGYFLIPVNSAQKSFVVVGAAGAGKSVLLRVISEVLLGRENVSNVSWQALNERFKLAELFGKLANVFADLPTKNIDDNGIFKALVGEDYLTAERKNKDPFSFQSTARLLFSCNTIPRNYGDRSEGFYRRLIILPFDKTIPEEERDPALLSKLSTEADGILMFALEGLQRLINNEFKFSIAQRNRDELQAYREASDSVLAFVRDCCVKESNATIGSTELYNSYKQYCVDSGMAPYSQKTFTQNITMVEGIGKAKDTHGYRRIIRGIKLAEFC